MYVMPWKKTQKTINNKKQNVEQDKNFKRVGAVSVLFRLGEHTHTQLFQIIGLILHSKYNCALMPDLQPHDIKWNIS